MIKIFSSLVKSMKKTQVLSTLKLASRGHKLAESNSYLFSQSKERLPKNKQEAWLMQQQKKLKQTPNMQDDGKSYSGYTKYGIASMLILGGSFFYLVYKADKTNQQQLDFFQEEISGLKELKNRESFVGGDWTLIDTEGRPFSSSMLSGYYYLVYFGYTNCPDICPSTLYYLTSVYRIIRNLPEGAYLKLKIVFISIDPQRDSPQIIKDYLSNFSKSFIGVTGRDGNDNQLKECMKKFKIKSHKIEKAGNSDKSKYEIDHTTRVYLMDNQNIYLHHLDPSLSEQQSAKAILAKIVTNEHRNQKLEDATTK